jgi:hypothetical protein
MVVLAPAERRPEEEEEEEPVDAPILSIIRSVAGEHKQT